MAHQHATYSDAPADARRSSSDPLALAYGAGWFAVVLLASYTAAHQLTSWAEWIVLANLVLCTIGVALAVNGHLFFRKR